MLQLRNFIHPYNTVKKAKNNSFRTIFFQQRSSSISTITTAPIAASVPPAPVAPSGHKNMPRGHKMVPRLGHKRVPRPGHKNMPRGYKNVPRPGHKNMSPLGHKKVPRWGQQKTGARLIPSDLFLVLQGEGVLTLVPRFEQVDLGVRGGGVLVSNPPGGTKVFPWKRRHNKHI